MKKLLVLFFYCLGVYQGYAQTNARTILAFYPQVPDTFEWSEQQIIDILKNGDISFCKLDMFLERHDTTFYIKDMELPISQDSIFDSVYMESSIFYGERRKDQKHIHCTYIVIEDKFGGQLELTEDALAHLPGLSKYLDKKIRKTHLKECKNCEQLSSFD